MKTARFTTLVAGILALLSHRAFAATPTYYTNRTTFEAALNTIVKDDYSNPAYVFNQSNAVMSAVLGETDYYTTGFVDWNLVWDSGGDYRYCAGCNGSFRLSFQTTSVGTGVGVYGVGIDITNNDSALPYWAYIIFGDGTTANIALPAGASFWAVTVPQLVESIHFGLSGGGTTQSGSFAIDNLTIGSGGATCGNGVLEAGEQCDDGNTSPGDGCSPTCRYEVCGNGIVDPGEVCDDGNTSNGDGCNATCTSNETCGNGIVDGQVGEQCDDGNTNPGDGCSATCRLEFCGNGTVDPGEICDDGNTSSGDGCSADCQSDETCGNGIVDTAAGEDCDDGNTVNGDGCSATCQNEGCGNGSLDPGEVCDDGNTADGDGCSANCLSDETCGNGIVDTAVGETCDDGNTSPGDGCSANCRLESCGNGTVESGEACDDGNNTSGDGCSADCLSDETCGNGIVDTAVGEACDDGNTVDGDGCQADCSLPGCGDGVLDPGEACDDGNRIGGDGCNATCTSDETCGNGVVDFDAGEYCDDGNTEPDDGCSAICLLEYCGNGALDGKEVCDDGNNVSGDGCSIDCLSDETCGNNIIDAVAGEECDDGVYNNDDHGPCTTSCTHFVPGPSSSSSGGCDCAAALPADAPLAVPLLLLVFGLTLLLVRRRRGS